MHQLSTIGCILLIGISCTPAQQPSRLDNIVNHAVSSYLADTATAGLSLGIVTEGKEYTWHFGTTTKNKQLPPTDRTVYEIGSISKTFTGTLVAHAVQEGKMNLNDDIRQFLPESFPNLSYKEKPITVAHVLTHYGGLPRFLPDRPDIFNQSPDSIPFALARLHAGYTKKDFLRDLHHVQPDTLPGTRYRYSNVGAQLMAIILEQLYNKSFAALADSLILRPNGIRHLLADNSDDNPVQGYNAKSQPMPLMPPLMLAAGGIRSTVRDMLGYLRYQLNDADPVIVQAHTPVWEGTEGQALGFFWRITALPGGGKKIWHTGGTFGFSSYCVLYPEKKTGIVLLSNEMDGTSQGRLIDIAEQIVTELD